MAWDVRVDEGRRGDPAEDVGAGKRAIEAVGGGGLATATDAVPCGESIAGGGFEGGACAGAAVGLTLLGLGGKALFGQMADWQKAGLDAGAFAVGSGLETWDILQAIACG